MRIDYQFAKSCALKKSFDSKRAAKQFSITNLGMHRDRRPQVPYKCRYCGGWHLTSEDARERELKRIREHDMRERGL